MANKIVHNTTITAGENLDDCQYRAVSLTDGKLASNCSEAAGILMNKPRQGEHVSCITDGEFFFRAGAAISRAARLSVTASGWFITAGSYDTSVGRSKEDVTSGSIGTGLFEFKRPAYTPGGFTLFVTAAEDIPAGAAYALNDNRTANSASEASGVTASGVSSGQSGKIVPSGIANGLMGGAVTAGAVLSCTTSGYFVSATSGDTTNGMALSTASSGDTAPMLFTGIGYLGE